MLLGVGAFLLKQPATAPAAVPAPAVLPQRPASVVDRPAPPAQVETAGEAAKPKAGPPKNATTRDALAAPRVEAAPTVGSLHVVADVADASVFVDRKYIGTAPVTAKNVAPGPHHLNVSAVGYDGVSEDIEVTPGVREVLVTLKTVRLAATLQVVHKHALGSCTGTLRASPQDVTYETTNTHDGFTVALADIERFDVDYLNKNLRLTINNGKTYNFADPDGNADRLFVFHRDVEHVRQRQTAGP
jgi:hypothetical protein